MAELNKKGHQTPPPLHACQQPPGLSRKAPQVTVKGFPTPIPLGLLGPLLIHEALKPNVKQGGRGATV